MQAAARLLKISIDICVEPDGDEFHAYCPALKGLHTFGATEDEAVSHAMDAAIAYLQSLVKHGDPIPVACVELPQAPGTPRHESPVVHHRVEDVSLDLTYA